MLTKEVCTDITKFTKPVQKRFDEMSKNELYKTNVENLYDKYLEAYPEGTNPMYKQRTVHDCNTCKQFIRRLGNVVNIKNGKIETVWQGHNLPYPYSVVAEKMHEIVSKAAVVSVFRTKEPRFGTETNFDKNDERYDHFVGAINSKHRTDNPETKIGELAAIYQVMNRGLNEIQMNHLDEVIDLINSNGLYRGEEHLDAIKGFKELLQQYQKATNKELFVWENIYNRNARFRNTVIGTMLVELAEGKDLENAIKSFEVKVAPANYKRPTAIITQAMVEKAVQTLTDLGLHGAIARRYARLSDVSVNDVLFVDNEVKGKMKDGITALLESSVKKSMPDLKHATKTTAEKFIADILPGAKTVEVLVENRHLGNFVSLTGADGQERLFKWNNNYAWSYDGDVADSVKQRVKAAGGNVNALLRVSLSWYNYDDLDLHAMLPDGNKVYYASKQGILDVDMNAGTGKTRNAVENLAFQRLQDGIYRISVHQFNRRETIDVGFAIEVEYNGQIHQYNYPKAMKTGEYVQCFQIHVKNNRVETIDSNLTGEAASQEKWGIKTQTLVPVSAIMYSPNHWGQEAVGAKHTIFALKNCKNPDKARGIYNEFLRSDLEQHRKVFEVLGAKTKCPPSDEQVSGLGFTAARGDSVTVIVNGKSAYSVTF